MEDNATFKTLEADKIGNMPCDFYKRASIKDSYYEGTVDLWLRKCMTPKFANPVYEMRKLPYDSPEQKYYKSNNIQAATLSCTCGKKQRCKDNVEHVNPLVVIDIDYHPGKDENKFLLNRAEKLDFMNRLINTGYVYAVGSSCRGTGIWAIFVLATTDIERHFNALIDDFKKFEIELDSSCRDVTRLRFASPDDIIRTPYKTLKCYQKKKDGEKEQEVKKVKPYRSHDSFMEKELMKEFEIKSKINSLLSLGFTTDTYEEWFQACVHLLPFGQEGFESFVDISQMSGNFTGVYDCQLKWMQNSKEPPRYTPEQCRDYWNSKLNRFEELLKQNLTS